MVVIALHRTSVHPRQKAPRSRHNRFSYLDISLTDLSGRAQNLDKASAETICIFNHTDLRIRLIPART